MLKSTLSHARAAICQSLFEYLYKLKVKEGEGLNGHAVYFQGSKAINLAA